MEPVKINEASTWTWEDGHASISHGWNEGVNESTWLRVYDVDGKPLKDMFDKDVFVESKSDNLLSNLESTIDPLYNNTSN